MLIKIILLKQITKEKKHLKKNGAIMTISLRYLATKMYSLLDNNTTTKYLS